MPGGRRATHVILLMLWPALIAGCSEENPADDTALQEPARKAPLASDGPPESVSVKPEPPFILPMAPGVTMEFVGIPPGSFVMGVVGGDLLRQKIRFAKPFYLGRTEVTQEQWSAVMAGNPSAMKGGKYPVNRVDWPACRAFVKAMNEKYGATGMKFALPTEAQWEYACRAGAVLGLDSSDDPNQIERYAWLGSNSHYEPHLVAQKKPNAWGLYDMQGNVAEWCVHESRLGSNAADPRREPEAVADSDDEPVYVVRGGNYREGASACSSTSRFPRRAVVPLRQDGLRLLCTPR